MPVGTHVGVVDPCRGHPPARPGDPSRPRRHPLVASRSALRCCCSNRRVHSRSSTTRQTLPGGAGCRSAKLFASQELTAVETAVDRSHAQAILLRQSGAGSAVAASPSSGGCQRRRRPLGALHISRSHHRPHLEQRPCPRFLALPSPARSPSLWREASASPGVGGGRGEEPRWRRSRPAPRGPRRRGAPTPTPERGWSRAWPAAQGRAWAGR